MTRVRTGSRLHFGLFRLPPPEPWPAGERFFGGLGMMIEEPVIAVAGELNSEWHVAGPNAGRVQRVLDILRDAYPDLPPQHISVESAPSAHAGFGTGTQLSLAVASAVLATGGLDIPIPRLAQILGRGKRSAIGVHGFAGGGFIVDGGKSTPDDIGQLARRHEFPEDWRIVLVTPIAAATWEGDFEAAAVARVPPSADLRPFAESAVLPALVCRDLPTFAAALSDFNARAGDVFASIQGGRYSSAATSAAVAALLAIGAAGAGQSSWGPTAYGLFGDPDQAGHAAAALAARFSHVSMTRAKNNGADMSSQGRRAEQDNR